MLQSSGGMTILLQSWFRRNKSFVAIPTLETEAFVGVLNLAKYPFCCNPDSAIQPAS